ncbi:peptide ABC transporter substrate-binding protein [Wenjunlia vitaminophila]|uniref:Peptide ABC transporter substrate-binding protein n=1 Tax=Wenjunlia vitaminophila TaxID=76728 RepID=A0A0T6LM04_WENVI|nr:ABC transporter substrate-binding protein [Wenjunlia vitaminophila]KRV47048.1 peptide ABC transporter substrate-binding protein [Wenjunlia vitaminophila]
MRGSTRAKWVVSAAVIALAATACGGGGDDDGDNESKGGSEGKNANSAGVVRAYWTDPQNPLEPANTNEVQGGKVMDMIFTKLMEYDPKTGEAFEANAEKITSTDSQTFTVKLKSGWTFADGTPVTAKNYVDAWNYGALLDNAQANAYFFSDIEGYDAVHPEEEGAKATAKTMSGLKVVDESTFTVKLKQKFSTWPKRLGYTAYAPLPDAFFKDKANYLKKPFGNGPYKVDSYTKGQGMKLSVNDKYALEKPKNGGVELKVYTDNTTAYSDLLAGNLDILDGLPASSLQNVETDLNGRYINQPAGILQTVSFPFYDKKWDQKKTLKVRQGLSMAIDRKAITENIFSNTRTPAKDWTSPVLGESGGFSQDMCGEYCEYNPEKAKQLIEEGGGIPGGTVTLTSNVDTGSHKDWMDAVCNSINKVMGSEKACLVKSVGTFGDFRNQAAGHEMSGMFRSGWQMDYPLIDNFLTPLYKTNASSNDGLYSNKEFDKLIDQANAEPDYAKAIKLYQDAEKIVAQEIPAITLWYQNGDAGYSDKVDNVTLDPFSVPVFTDITVKS